MAVGAVLHGKLVLMSLPVTQEFISISVLVVAVQAFIWKVLLLMPAMAKIAGLAVFVAVRRDLRIIRRMVIAENVKNAMVLTLAVMLPEIREYTAIALPIVMIVLLAVVIPWMVMMVPAIIAAEEDV